MKVELDAETFSFNGLAVNADALVKAVADPTHFYRFVNDGETVQVEKYALKDIERFLCHE